MFHALGVRKDDVVSFYVAAVAGSVHHAVRRRSRRHRQSGQPAIGAASDRGNPGSRGHTVLVALGPVPGTDIWQKVEKVRGHLKHLKAIVQVGPAIPLAAFTRSPS